MTPDEAHERLVQLRKEAEKIRNYIADTRRLTTDKPYQEQMRYRAIVRLDIALENLRDAACAIPGVTTAF